MKSSVSPSMRAAALLPAFLACLLYANTLRNGFTIDDGFAYADNTFVKHPRNLPRLFTQDYFKYSNEASYRPVCTLTYFVDAALWPAWSGGPHLTNVLLYAGVVVVFFFMCLRVTGDGRGALLGAVLFALHPVHNEVVNNIGFREDLLVGLLLPLSWLLYRRATGGRGWLWLPLAWGVYLLATLAKESAIVFPALAVLLEAAGRNAEEDARNGKALTETRPNGRTVYLAGLVLVSVFFLVLRFHWMQFEGEAAQPRLGGSLAGTLLADVKIQAWYLRLLVFPYPLLVFYPPAMYAPRLDAALLGSLAGLLVVPLLLIVLRRSRTFIVAVLWWFVCLAPVSNVYPIFNPMAERYLFLASMGPCLWAGQALADWIRRPARKAAAGWRLRAAMFGVATWCAAAAVGGVLRNRTWRDNLTLWRRTADAIPENATVVSNLAAAHFEKGDFDGVIKHARRALALREQGKDALNPAATLVALSSALYMQGRRDEALEHLLAAETFIPCRFDIDVAIYRNIGLIYDDREELGKALEYYLRAAEIDPFLSELWRKISFCRLRLGDREGAKRDWDEARRLDAGVPAFEKIEAMVEAS